MDWHQEQAERERRDEFGKQIRDRIGNVAHSADYPGLSREDMIFYGQLVLRLYETDDLELKDKAHIYGGWEARNSPEDKRDETFQRRALLEFAGNADYEIAAHIVKTAFGLKPGKEYGHSIPAMKFPDYIQRAITSETARTGNYALLKPEEWNEIVAYTFLEEDSPDEGIQNLPEAPEADVLWYLISNAENGIIYKQAGAGLLERTDPEKIAAISWANQNGFKLMKEEQTGEQHDEV